MKKMFSTWGFHFKDSSFVWSFIISILLLGISLVINFYAAAYATAHASMPVTDIILSNIRMFDVDAIFIYGPWAFWVFSATLVASKPYRIPFIVKNIALFIVIRSVFISLTHIGPFPGSVIVEPTFFIGDFSPGGDLFFSAHTGLPYLMALIFWNEKKLRYFFIATSIFFGIVVLLGHLHYSIDVLSAFFITYSIYHIAETIFEKDKKVFNSGLVRT